MDSKAIVKNKTKHLFKMLLLHIVSDSAVSPMDYSLQPE